MEPERSCRRRRQRSDGGANFYLRSLSEVSGSLAKVPVIVSEMKIPCSDNYEPICYQDNDGQDNGSANRNLLRHRYATAFGGSFAQAPQIEIRSAIATLLPTAAASLRLRK